jgi:hypothetical protein
MPIMKPNSQAFNLPGRSPLCRTCSVKEAALVLGVGTLSIYRMIRMKYLVPLPHFRHKRIPCVQLEKILGEQSQED